MEKLIRKIDGLQKGSISKTVASRLCEFKENGRDPGKIFSELCFCICTANNSAERGLRAQKEIDFCGLPEKRLRKRMKEVVCRFYNHKTEYIMAARRSRKKIIAQVRSAKDARELREWLIKNVKGLGCKEASHFLRNIGFEDVAIIDFHIIDILAKNRIIRRPKTLTIKNYLKIEERLSKIAAETKTSLAALDLYLWCLETGKVLK